MIKVHVIASKSNVIEDIQNLRNIVKFINKKEHKIVDDWIEKVYVERTTNNTPPIDWSSIYTSNLETIAKADAIIAETSYNSFGVGYQIAVAAQQKKPILLLRHEKAETDAFATGVVDSWVRQATYTEKDLESVVGKFLHDNDITTKDMRFNFFIDRAIYNYLRWAAFKTGKTKAEILRELVQREIANKDY